MTQGMGQVGRSSRLTILLAFTASALLAACAQQSGSGQSPASTFGPALPTPVSGEARQFAGFVRLGVVNGSVTVMTQTAIFRLESDRISAALARPDDNPIESRPTSLDANTVAMVTSGGSDLAMYTSPGAGLTGLTWSRRGGAKIATFNGIAVLQLASVGDRLVVLATEASGTNTSYGFAAVSVDNGATWAVQRAPVGGWLTAAGGTFWLVGGPMGDQVFKSVDGSTWDPITLPVPAKYWTADQPVPVGSGVVIPVTTHNGDSDSDVLLIESRDNGATWSIAAETSAPATTFSTVIPSAIAPDGSWFVAYVDGSKVISGILGEPGTTVRSPNGLPPNIESLVVAGSQLVALAMPSSCPSGKDSCGFTTLLATTQDRGQTWNPVK